MTRLTHTIRDSIKLAVLRHRFTADIDALYAKYATLADDVYNDVVSKADRMRLAALPPGWFPSTSYVYAKFGEDNSSYDRINFSGWGHQFGYTHFGPSTDSRVERRVPYKLNGACWKVYETLHPLSLKYAALNNEKKSLEELIKSTEQQIKTVLYNTTSIDSLLKAWPEVAPFAQKYIDAPKVSLPAIPVAALNAALKLPVAS